MKRSEINDAIRAASACWERRGWALPPAPRWDVTDFSMGDFAVIGLTVVNLAEEPEYCEKLMYARRNQHTPPHHHRCKKEDIIVRAGRLRLQFWRVSPRRPDGPAATVRINHEPRTVGHGETVDLSAGERVTLTPGLWHAFWPLDDDTVIGEVSTRNDDLRDNVFADPRAGRFSPIDEDEPPLALLVSDLRDSGSACPG